LWNEFTSVLAVRSGRVRVSIGETSCDTSAIPVRKSEVVLWVGQELVQVSLRLVGDIAVVFLVEALGEHGVREFSLSTPMVCADVSRRINVMRLRPPHTIVSEKGKILALGV
jgi:hypothetical protein